MAPELASPLQQLHASLLAQGLTVATAESCTGGLVATFLTELAGSSAYYLGGVSAYANTAKTALLGVPEQLLARHGAVSAEVAEAMALGVRTRLGATYALSLTGIAGPGGGSPEKPVGTVFCGFAGPSGVSSARLTLAGTRGEIRAAAANAALQRLLTEINN